MGLLHDPKSGEPQVLQPHSGPRRPRHPDWRSVRWPWKLGWGESQPPARQDAASLPRTSDKEGHGELRSPAAGSARTARVPSALRGSQLGEGCAWAPPLAPPRLSLSGSRLQPSRLLLSLLHRLKTATVPELTPGDPESFLPHPLAHRHSVFSESAELWAATGRLLLPHLSYTAGLWGAGTRSTHRSPSSPPLRWVGAGPLQGGQAGPSSLCLLPSWCPTRGCRLQARK